MELTIKEIERKDHEKAIQFAITGMHFDMYLKNRFLLNLYGTYFWYDELNQATQVIAAYDGDELVGVLLAGMKDEPRMYRSVGKTVFSKVFDFCQNLLYSDCVGPYDAANREMYAEFTRENHPDGQIIFLAADSNAKIKGVGTALLAELERREAGKQIYLYTDDICTYQFYEHRGFERVGEKDAVLDMGTHTVPLKCLLYSKRCQG